MSEIDDLKVMVEEVLKEFPDSRNSDRLLTWHIWEKYFDIPQSITKERFFQLPSEDSVKRLRAHIQNIEHKYHPTSWEVAKKRKWNEIDWKRAMGYAVTDPNQPDLFPRPEEPIEEEFNGI